MKTGIIIGRFSPLHIGHEFLIKKAYDECDELIILIGSAFQAKTFKNPFSFKERKEMIIRSFNKFNANVHIYPIPDYYSDYLWKKDVENIINKIHNEKILYGFKKDDSSYYLDMFPDLKFKEVFSGIELDATEIRVDLFERGYINTHRNGIEIISESVRDYLINGWMQSSDFGDLRTEFIYNKIQKEKWKTAPYPPIFVTVDSVIMQDDKVFLIKRKSFPGKGLMALPGGFINEKERLIDAAIRIAQEKIPGIKLNNLDALDSIVQDAPNRSLRGRTISHIFLFRTRNFFSNNSGWFSLDEINKNDFREQMFEDHVKIIEQLLSKGERF